jgi:hypothetical protein
MKQSSPPRIHKTVALALAWTFGALLLLTLQATADPFSFSTGDPDGKIGTLARPPGGIGIQTETADDFILTATTLITNATFTGLLPLGAPLSSISNVEIEVYHVFPEDSDTNRTINVPTRVNSPADSEIDEATRDGLDGSLSFSATLLNASFAVSNSVVTGINSSPSQFTGGEGPVTGQEVLVSVSFNPPIELSAGHYFFRPEVLVTNGDFLWLSAPKPIVSPGTPFSPDLQSWIRNDDLAPDWLRIGTDITGEGPFNAAFSLLGDIPPHDLAVISVKPHKNINLKGAGPSLTKRVKVQIQNLSDHSETISDLTTLANLVSVTLSNVQDSGCTPPTADLIMRPPNKPKTIKPNGKLNVFFNVTFDPEGCVPDPEKGDGHHDFSYTATVDHAALDGNADTNPSNDTLDADVQTDVFLKQ